MVEYGFEQKSFQSKTVILFFVSLLVIVALVWAVVLSPDHGGLISNALNSKLRLDFINVGQGDAILVRTPMGKNFLIDGGTNVPSSQADSSGRVLVQSYLRDQGITHLDGIVVTHPHNDHIGGVNAVLSMFSVEKVWDCGVDFNTNVFKQFVDILSRRRIPRITAKAGDILDWGDELFVQVLHPDYVADSLDFSDINNMSVVLLIRYGLVRIMLTGDIEEEAMREILHYGEEIQSDFLKVPHHGSDTSINLAFIQTVAPKHGIIQVGRGNPFGHPSSTMLSLYDRLGIQTQRNDHLGTIRLKIGGVSETDFEFEVDRSF